MARFCFYCVGDMPGVGRFSGWDEGVLLLMLREVKEGVLADVFLRDRHKRHRVWEGYWVMNSYSCIVIVVREYQT